ncbi:putative carboxypeptidase [Ascodesmis nigricans]|uniref:Carboxypeptidase M14A n=1 Tax=Ascodesmis nigricans TaxID=341454 RepID=A0A4S2MRJ2_9PEZI|nr:putative carboxypeptidase [Ascodesmis nigricans]
MKFSLTALLTLALAVTAIPTQDRANKTHDGTKVIRVAIPDSAESAARLQTLVGKLDLPLWSRNFLPNGVVDVQVPKEKIEAFEAASIEWKKDVMFEDLGKSIREEADGIADEGMITISADVGTAAAPDVTWFNSYHSYADHLTWLNQMVAAYPNNAKIVTAGSSSQGRAITGIHIYGSNPGTKPGVIIHGTVHAREWITTMTTEYMAWNLLTTKGSDSIVASLLTKYDFYLFPVVNPDGFVYTQTNDRMWRKNRQSVSSSCYGVDINRNWANKWSGSGSSTSPCSETYRGPSQGSTPEVQGLAAFQNALSPKPKFYMDFHAYGQMWMFPYGYTCSANAPDHTELQSLSNGAVAALKAVSGTTYTAGPICKTIYAVNGDSVDYSYEVTGIKYSFTAELRPGSGSSTGFLLPAAQILPVGKETWAAMRYLWNNMV